MNYTLKKKLKLYICYVYFIAIKNKIKNKNFKWGKYHLKVLTFPFFSLGKPSQSLTSCPNWLQRPHGLGLFGLNSSLIMVKLGSCVARPSMMRSAINQQWQNNEYWAFWENPYHNQSTGHYHNLRHQDKERSKGIHRDGKAKNPNTFKQFSANKMSSRYMGLEFWLQLVSLFLENFSF